MNYMRLPETCMPTSAILRLFNLVQALQHNVNTREENGRVLALETLEQAKTRRQVALYFSMVRRRPCCASLDSRSTSFSSSTWAGAAE